MKQVHPQKYFKPTSFDDVFLNLYDFWNIAVSQGNAATSVRYGGLHNIYFVAKFCSESISERIWKIDQFFWEVIDMSRVFCFLTHIVDVKYILLLIVCTVYFAIWCLWITYNNGCCIYTAARVPHGSHSSGDGDDQDEGGLQRHAARRHRHPRQNQRPRRQGLYSCGAVCFYEALCFHKMFQKSFCR